MFDYSIYLRLFHTFTHMSISLSKSNVLLCTTGIALCGLTFYSFYRRIIKKQPAKTSIEPAKPISTLSQDEIYVQKAKQQFLDTFLQEGILNKPCGVNYNENIPSVFYDISDYKYAVLLDKNDLELSWKRRILMQSTPRGNVIMFYDVYKHGFSYYADNSVPYTVLNAVVMKYVLLYRCRHFFLDEQIVPIGCSSPFVALYCKETDTQNAKQNTAKKIDVKTGPFAKFAPKLVVEPPNNHITVCRREKTGWISWFLRLLGMFRHGSTSKIVSKDVNAAIEKKKDLNGSTAPIPEIVKNRMIYLGKCANFSMLLRPTIEIKPTVSVKQQQISYSSFKSWQNPDPAVFS